ncbi:MAG: carbonic anhydrase family protein, partial [Tetragenococcus halophilus]|nr:carbonic anhydrase family protein [Tetragenococcus halophilus]
MSQIWSYTGDTGPEFWPELCEEFYTAAQFPLQSPIALSYEETQALEEALKFTYVEQNIYVQKVNETMHFVPVDAASFVEFAQNRYYLTDIHFHMPSEHVINKQQAPLEFHLVHKDEGGNPLVCAVLFDLVENEDKKCNKDKLILEADKDKEQLLNPEIFLPENITYFHYEGSLTTPPTQGPVQWFVFDQIGVMSRS